MLSYLQQKTEPFWMGVYLRVLALIMAYGALIHGANLLGFAGTIEDKIPLSWTIGDVAYALIDTLSAIGLWQRTGWGILCFLSAIASQFLIYTVFIDYFAFNLDQRQTIYGLLGTEAILLLVFVLLLIAEK